MAKIESRPLPPLNPGASLNEQDRSSVYAMMGKELNDLLNGPASFYADGMRKDPQTLLSDLKRFRAGIQELQGRVDDPSGILTGIAEHLKSFADAFEKRSSADEPNDNIQMNPEYMPNTEDSNILYVNPNIDPRDSFPNSNPVAPENWKKYHDASLRSVERADPGRLTIPDDARGMSGGRLQASQSIAPRAAQNLTANALRMKGVPDADIGTALNDPAQMQNLLNQLYGRRPMSAPDADENGFTGNDGRGLRADRPEQASTQRAATPDTYLPFGWSGLPTLLR